MEYNQDSLVDRVDIIRTTVPSAQLLEYKNTEYGGYNIFSVKDTTTGYTLPNCTAYCYGRALETMREIEADLPNYNANLWFQQNKIKWDSHTGGYPYIDFSDHTISLNSGTIVDLGSDENLRKYINLPGCVTAGSIICYDQGQNYGYEGGGIYYPSPGHIMSIESIYNSDEGVGKAQVDELIRQLVNTAAEIGLSWLINTSVINLIKSGKTFVIAYLQQRIKSMVLKGTITLKDFNNAMNIINSFKYIIRGSRAVINAYTLGFTMQAIAAGGGAISSILDNWNSATYLYYKISESNISSSGNQLFDTCIEDLNINLNYKISHSTSINVQGIILLPIWRRPEVVKQGFPWQLGRNLGLYE